MSFQDVDSDAAKAFLEVANGMDDVPFAITSNADLGAEYKVKKGSEAVVLFKKVCRFCDLTLLILITVYLCQGM